MTKQDTRPLGHLQPWERTPSSILARQSHIDGVDATAITMERRWGCGRLRLLVSPELREKFDRQRYRLNRAAWHDTLEAVRVESLRMTVAWKSLSQAAEAAGAADLAPEVWEAVTPDGVVLAVVRGDEDAGAVVREGRAVVVFTMSELATMVHHYREVVKVKDVFPGATVERIRQTIDDPLDAFSDTEHNLDDPIPSFTGSSPLQ